MPFLYLCTLLLCTRSHVDVCQYIAAGVCSNEAVAVRKNYPELIRAMWVWLPCLTAVLADTYSNRTSATYLHAQLRSLHGTLYML